MSCGRKRVFPARGLLSAMLLAVVLSTLGLFSLAPSLAHADEGADVEQGVYQILGVGSKKFLDVAGSTLSEGDNVQLFSETRDSGQNWRLERVGDCYAIRNSVSGRALTVAGDGMSSGTNVLISSFDGRLGQLWEMENNEDGSLSIVSALNGLCLDAEMGGSSDGTNVQVYQPNGSAAQQWSLEKVERTVESGVYQISSALDSSKVLDVSNASTDNCARIQLWGGNGTDAQKWGLSFDDRTGFYTLVSLCSNKSADVPNASSESGVKIQQYEGNGTVAQLWSIIDRGDGYEIRSAVSGLALDVPDARATDGAQVQMYSPNGSAAQRWTISPANLGIKGIYQMATAVDGSKVLEISRSQTSGKDVAQVRANEGDLAQKWEVVPLEDGTFSLKNADTGLYLMESEGGLASSSSLSDQSRWRVSVGKWGYLFENVSSRRLLSLSGETAGDSTEVVMSGTTNDKSRAWTLSDVALVEDGYYVIANRSVSSQVIDVPNALAQNALALQTYESNGTPAQKWRVERRASGQYKISNAASGLVLDVRNGEGASGNVVQQYESNDSAAQCWTFSIAPGGGVRVASALGDFVLAVANSTPSSGSTIVISESSDDSARAWTFEPTDYTPTVDPGPTDPTPAGDVPDIWGDAGYVSEMRERASRVGSQTGIVAVVDKGRDRTTVFRHGSDGWVLANSMDVITSGNTFTGVHTVYITARGYWKEPNCINVNDWYVGYVEDWWSSPSSDNMRYVEGKGYDEGQGFHYGFYGTGCICIPDYDKAKWLHDNMGVGSTVYIF